MMKKTPAIENVKEIQSGDYSTLIRSADSFRKSLAR